MVGFLIIKNRQQMATFPEQFATLRTLLVFNFVRDLLFVSFNVIGLFEKKNR